jgi:hypothetical protein
MVTDPNEIESEADRPQDVARKSRVKVDPSSTEVIERYRRSMRRDLDGLLDELDGLQTLAGRARLWDLAGRLASSLIATSGYEPPSSTPATRRTSPAPRLSSKVRRDLGG